MAADECRKLTGKASVLKRRLKALHAAFTEQRLRTACLSELADLTHLTGLIWHVESPDSVRRLASSIEARRARVEHLEAMLRSEGAGAPGLPN